MLEPFQGECPDCGSKNFTQIRKNSGAHYHCDEDGCGKEWETFFKEMIDLPQCHEIKQPEYDRIYATVLRQERAKQKSSAPITAAVEAQYLYQTKKTRA